MGWFRRKTRDHAPEHLPAPTVPLEAYAPVLHRVVRLSLDHLGVSERVTYRGGGGDTRDRVLAALQADLHASVAEQFELKSAWLALHAVQPLEPELADLHFVVKSYGKSNLEYFGYSDEYFMELMTGNNRKKVRYLQSRSDEWKEVLGKVTVDLREAIRLLHDANRWTYGRLGFASRELIWLHLDDLAAELPE